jgi:hypothetical protein
MAQELANQHTDYFPDRPGRWVYDREDNDIRYIQKPRRSKPSAPQC